MTATGYPRPGAWRCKKINDDNYNQHTLFFCQVCKETQIARARKIQRFDDHCLLPLRTVSRVSIKFLAMPLCLRITIVVEALWLEIFVVAKLTTKIMNNNGTEIGFSLKNLKI